MKTNMRKVILGLLFNCIMGAIIASFLGFDALMGAVVANMLAIAVGQFVPKGVACDGVLTEVWTGELIRALRANLEASWLNGVPDQSSVVDNDVIHMVDVGADPQVLVK